MAQPSSAGWGAYRTGLVLKSALPQRKQKVDVMFMAKVSEFERVAAV